MPRKIGSHQTAQAGDATPWWSPARHLDRRPALIARHTIKQALRRWFLDEGFIEVDTAALQVSPGNELHLHAFQTRFTPLDGGPDRTFYLHTSPEFACKKLLAAGETKIFTFAPCFRNGEHTRLHHPEFTMLEWYRTEHRLPRLDGRLPGSPHRHSRRHRRAPLPPAGIFHSPPKLIEEIAVLEAFQRFAEIDLRATYSSTTTNREALASAATSRGVKVADDDTWSDIFTRVLLERVEPELGRSAPTILKDYPLPEAALAAPAPGDAMIAERFELYLAGLELANAFTELADPAEQRRRFEADMSEKKRRYGFDYPIDEDFLDALAIMPPAAGAALGFDRLVMIATGAPRIEDVLWTPMPLTRSLSRYWLLARPLNARPHFFARVIARRHRRKDDEVIGAGNHIIRCLAPPRIDLDMPGHGDRAVILPRHHPREIPRHAPVTPHMTVPRDQHDLRPPMAASAITRAMYPSLKRCALAMFPKADFGISPQ